MSINIDQNNKDQHSNNKVLAGSVLLVIGIAILVHQLNFFFFPWWLFSWPMWLIALGVYSGVKHNFRNSSWIIWIGLGIFFLFDKIFPYAHIFNNFWPIIFIAIGIKMIMNRNRPWNRNRWDKDSWNKKWDGGSFG